MNFFFKMVKITACKLYCNQGIIKTIIILKKRDDLCLLLSLLFSYSVLFGSF